MSKKEIELRFRDLFMSMKFDDKLSKKFYYKIMRVYEQLDKEYGKKEEKK